MPTNNVKTLKTRIALKYDSYTNWTTSPGKDLVLLKGEIEQFLMNYQDSDDTRNLSENNHTILIFY